MKVLRDSQQGVILVGRCWSCGTIAEGVSSEFSHRNGRISEYYAKCPSCINGDLIAHPKDSIVGRRILEDIE